MISQPTGITCPRCGKEVHAQGGVAGNVVIAAAHAQAARLGVEITCDGCSLTFIYRLPGAEPQKGKKRKQVPPPHISLDKSPPSEDQIPLGSDGDEGSSGTT